MPKPKVLILVGSKTDTETMQQSYEILKQFKIPCQLIVSSAHRNPAKTHKIAKQASQKGVKVIICAAGMAAHLAGAVASETFLPVIGVPMANSYFKGTDAFLSTLQMPYGIPVATMSVGNSGAKNAAVLAAQILALSDAKLRKRLQEFKKSLAQG